MISAETYVNFSNIESPMDDVMPFGKYKGESVYEIPLSYLEWLVDNIDLQEPLATEVNNAIDWHDDND